MEHDVIIKEAYHFSGITILVPRQRNQESNIIPVNRPELIPDEIFEKRDDFNLIRVIANIALFRREDLDHENFEEPVQTFDPPIEIRVNYNLDDVIQADCDIEQLKLAYWDGKDWVLISDEDHEYQILPASTAPVAEAKIWSWIGDPPIIWGT